MTVFKAHLNPPLCSHKKLAIISLQTAPALTHVLDLLPSSCTAVSNYFFIPQDSLFDSPVQPHRYRINTSEPRPPRFCWPAALSC